MLSHGLQARAIGTVENNYNFNFIISNFIALFKHSDMDLVRKITFKNSVFTQVLWGIVIIIAVCYIGYMLGKFTWYVSK